MAKARWSTVFGMVLAVTASMALTACTDSDSGEQGICTAETDQDSTVAAGVTYISCEYGDSQAHLLRVDLTAPGVRMGVVMPEYVSTTEKPTEMGEQAGAVAVVNGDFFNNHEDSQANASHTDAPVGPMVVSGVDLKSAVPDDQRMGPDREDPYAANDTVFGITAGGRAMVSSLELRGLVHTPDGSFKLDAFNSYAIPVDGIGVYTSEWGPGLRHRALCGTDEDRKAPCSESAIEVKVTNGVVTDMNDLSSGSSIVSGQFEQHETVFMARDAPARWLSGLEVGDPVTWEHELYSPDGYEFAHALGGLPLIVGGEVVHDFSGKDDEAPRTVAAYSDDGMTVYLVVVDGRTDENPGVTLQQITELVQMFGVQGAVALDGGGSSLMAAIQDGGSELEHLNNPSDPWLAGGGVGEERPVANALAIFGDPSAEADDQNAPDDQNPPGDSESSAAPDEFSALEGSWNVVPTSPGQASTLTFDAEGNATYTTEGTIVDHWAGTVQIEDDSTFTVDFEAAGSVYEDDEGVDLSDRGFTMEFELSSDGETITVFGEYGNSEYVRAD